MKAVSCLFDKIILHGNDTAKDIKNRRSAGKRLKVTFKQFHRSVSPTISRALKPSDTYAEARKQEAENIPPGEELIIKTTTTSQKKPDGGKGGGGGGGGKLDKLPEYLRETVDWFMG